MDIICIYRLLSLILQAKIKKPDSSPVIKAGRGTPGTASAKIQIKWNTAKNFMKKILF